MTRPRFFAAVAAWAFAAVLGLSMAQAQAAPVFKNISAIVGAQGGNADPTLTLPAHAANDVLLVATLVRSGTATVAMPVAWTEIGTATVRAGTATYQFFWTRATGTNSVANPVINRTGTTGDVFAAAVNYSGAITTGDPWEVKGTPATGTGDPASCAGITTLSDNALVVAALAGENNNNSAVTAAGTNPAAYTEHYLESSVGGDGMIAFSEAVRATAGATGNVSVDFNSGNPNGWGCIVLALKAPPGPTLSSAADQTFSIGDPPTLAATLTITEHSTTPSITAAQNIRIRIPSTFSMTWDPAITAVTLSGSAAGKVSAALLAYEDGNRTAVLDVTADFAAGEVLTISALGFRDFTVAEAADNLELVVAGSGGATASEDNRSITIAAVSVLSAGSRILNDNAARTPVAAEDADVTGWDKAQKFLVTIGIQTTAGFRCRNNQGASKLEWRNVTDAPNTWNTLGTAAGPEMRLFDSVAGAGNLSHGGQLTQAEAQITGTGTWNDGEEAESNADIAWNSDVRNGEHTAIQFPIDPSGGTDGKTYQFRFTVNPGLCDGGSSILSVSITLGALPSSIGRFNAYDTGSAGITGVIKTKIAGSSFALDLIALDPAKTAIETGFTGAVKVELLNAVDNSGALDANGCRSSWSVIQTLSTNPVFASGDNGRKSVTFSEANSWPDTRVRVSYPATGTAASIGCSDDNFAIRPNSFVNLSVFDADWETAWTSGAARSLDSVTFASVTHKAGRPFNIAASARNATNAVTGNYAGTADAVLSACAGAACTSVFGTLTVGATFSGGALASGVATYNNVGAFRMRLRDTSFASVDASDSTGSERFIESADLDVGRFVPDHFAVSLNTPVFQPTCGPFTYLGQPFVYSTAPQITVTARDFANNTTTLYSGSWWRITNTTLTPATQAGRYTAAGGVSLDTGLLPLPAADPAIDGSSPGSGVGTLTFAGTTLGTALAFQRPTSPAGTPAAPVAPFDADISLAVNIVDADGVVYASNPARFGQAIAGNGISFSDGNGATTSDKQMRFGRLRLENAVGSEKLNLPIPIRTEYWTGTAFQTNTADGCTFLTTANAGLSGYSGGITATNMDATHISGFSAAFSNGIGNLTLAAPTPVPATPGAVTVTIDLSVGGFSYLSGNWGITTYTANPTSRAAFGLYGSQPSNFIYFRENY